MIRISVLIFALAAVSPDIGMAHPGIELAAQTAVRGDAGDASRLLARLAPDQLQIEDRSFRQCMISRFGSSKPEALSPVPGDPFVRGVLSAYQTYWHSALRNPKTEPKARKQLVSRLVRLARLDTSDADRRALRNLSHGEYQTLRTLSLTGGGPGYPGFDLPSYADLTRRSLAQEKQANDHAGTTLDAVSPVIRQRLSDLGYFSIEREAGNLRDLVLWGKQTTRPQEVQIANDPRAVTVVYMDDIYSLGWKDYATCSRSTPQGWLAEDSLYIAVDRSPAMAKQTSTP
ncbi:MULTISPECIES: hypothetical protein [unclassified Pseudoxanthomonas]|uniref:hypothetical protein n=1 Tax=unclassified Pseudoxanthomonas TaxID=2645906 RepID=UPI003077FBF0